MTTFAHILLYAILLGTSIVSGIGNGQGTDKQDRYELAALERETTDSAIPEIKEPYTHREAYSFGFESVKVYDASNGKVEEYGLEDYIKGVLLAEMPSWYDDEALKAGAVAARTYTLYKMETSSHKNGADICTDSRHCQAFKRIDEAVQAWGAGSAESACEKIRMAVDATRGEILVFDGKPILAVYHASSYLKTRSSEEVFGGSVPYLVSVSVPFEDINNTRISEKRFKIEECERILGKKFDSLSSVWENEQCLGLEVRRGEEVSFIDSADVRNMFSLNSASFDVSCTESEAVFSVYGYGHGVGLSQTGAQVMASGGSLYDEILLKYYKDVKIAKIEKYE